METAEKELTLEEVRAVLADKSRAGYTEQVKELLKKHGADKLSAVDPAESFTVYQKGMELLKYCNESIDKVEKKVLVLNGEGKLDEF